MATLPQLKDPTSIKESSFRDNLMRMLTMGRVTQLMITYFQEDELLKSDTGLKPLKRFSKEVFSKLEWFYSTIKKIAGENAVIIEQELENLEGDKINQIFDLVGAVLMDKKNINAMVDMVTNSNCHKEMLRDVWKQSRFSFSPKMQLDEPDFDKWYSERFPEQR